MAGRIGHQAGLSSVRSRLCCLARPATALGRRFGHIGRCRLGLNLCHHGDGRHVTLHAQPAGRCSTGGRFGRRNGCRRRQGLQQRFAIIGRFNVGTAFGAVCALRPPIAAITLPFPRAILTRTLFTGAFFTGTAVALPLFALAIIAAAFIPILVVTGPVVTNPVIPILAVAILILAALILSRPLVPAITPIGGAGVARIAGINLIGVVIAIIGRIIVGIHGIIIKAITAPTGIGSTFGLAITIVTQHPVIMFGILQIIFRRHPIPGLLRIARQGPVFFQQLGGIAALAVVEPRAIIVATSHLLRARAVVAATAPPPLVVPDQDPNPRFLARCLALSGPLVGEIMPLHAVATPGGPNWPIRNRPCPTGCCTG